LNLTAYCIGGAGQDYVTIINKTQGASPEPGDASATSATLGGASITGDSPWQGAWSPLPTDPQAGITVTVSATTAVILRIPTGS
jgi:hypothetical protein